MKFLLWVKKYLGWLLGGILVVLGVIFAVKYEKSKIYALRDRVAESKKVHAALVEGSRSQLLLHEKNLSEEGKQIAAKVALIDKKLNDLNLKIKESQPSDKSSMQVSEEFNRRYHE